MRSCGSRVSRFLDRLVSWSARPVGLCMLPLIVIADLAALVALYERHWWEPRSSLAVAMVEDVITRTRGINCVIYSNYWVVSDATGWHPLTDPSPDYDALW